MNDITNIATVVVAVVALIGVCVGIVAWFYRRGGQERAFADALAENTESNREVAAELRDFKTQTLIQLTELDWRVKTLEQRS